MVRADAGGPDAAERKVRVQESAGPPELKVRLQRLMQNSYGGNVEFESRGFEVRNLQVVCPLPPPPQNSKSGHRLMQNN